MVWTVDDNGPRATFNRNRHVAVPASGMRRYYDWKRLIEAGTNPIVALDQLGSWDHHHEIVNTHHTVRLSQEHRVVFDVDTNSETVTILRIGGHYP